MGGRLRAESTPGSGSRFSFDLALPDADGGQELRDSPPPGEVAVYALVAANPAAVPSDAEIDALLALSLAGDIVPLRQRLAALARNEPACADFAGELERLATGFRMDAIGEFLQRARSVGKPAGENGHPTP